VLQDISLSKATVGSPYAVFSVFGITETSGVPKCKFFKGRTFISLQNVWGLGDYQMSTPI